MGGSGKTPFTIYLANLLKRENLSVAILTRGYKKSGSGLKILKNPEYKISYREYGDEPLLLGYNLSDIPILISKNRINGIKYLENLPESPQVAILDDGFQYLKLFRDVDIVLIDSKNPFYFDKKIGCNLLRESIKSVKYSHCVIFTKSSGEFKREKIKEILKFLGKEHPIFFSYMKRDGIYNFLNERIKGLNANGKFLAISGIANNDQFFKLLRDENILPEKEISLKDHHKYNSGDIKSITGFLEKGGYVITTEKDFVKLKDMIPDKFKEKSLYLKIKVVLEEEKKFLNFLNEKLS